MFHLNQALRDRADLRDKATAILANARKENRAVTEAEQTAFDSLYDRIATINSAIDRHKAGLPQPGQENEIVPLFPRQERTPQRNNNSAPGFNLTPGSTPNLERLHEDLAAFYRGQEIVATDSPLYIGSGGLSSTVPTSVIESLPTYFVLDSFARAGATVYQTEDTNPLTKPIISAGAAPSTYSEGTSSTDSNPFQVDSFTFHGTKYSRLVKASEESLMNSALDLPGEITSELSASVVNAFTAAISTALMVALDGNPAVFVDSGSNDPYYSLNALINAVPPRFDTPQNAFMGSRASRLLISNARDNYGRPLFDPVTNTVLGKPYIVNDNLTRVVYGSWRDGCFVRKSPFFLQRLLEAYSDDGEQGFRATQWLDSKFLASVTAVTTQPLFFTHLETAGS